MPEMTFLSSAPEIGGARARRRTDGYFTAMNERNPKYQPRKVYQPAIRDYRDVPDPEPVDDRVVERARRQTLAENRLIEIADASQPSYIYNLEKINRLSMQNQQQSKYADKKYDDNYQKSNKDEYVKKQEDVNENSKKYDQQSPREISDHKSEGPVQSSNDPDYRSKPAQEQPLTPPPSPRQLSNEAPPDQVADYQRKETDRPMTKSEKKAAEKQRKRAEKEEKQEKKRQEKEAMKRGEEPEIRNEGENYERGPPKVYERSQIAVETSPRPITSSPVNGNVGGNPYLLKPDGSLPPTPPLASPAKPARALPPHRRALLNSNRSASGIPQTSELNQEGPDGQVNQPYVIRDPSRLGFPNRNVESKIVINPEQAFAPMERIEIPDLPTPVGETRAHPAYEGGTPNERREIAAQPSTPEPDSPRKERTERFAVYEERKKNLNEKIDQSHLYGPRNAPRDKQIYKFEMRRTFVRGDIKDQRTLFDKEKTEEEKRREERNMMRHADLEEEGSMTPRADYFAWFNTFEGQEHLKPTHPDMPTHVMPAIPAVRGHRERDKPVINERLFQQKVALIEKATDDWKQKQLTEIELAEARNEAKARGLDDLGPGWIGVETLDSALSRMASTSTTGAALANAYFNENRQQICRNQSTDASSYLNLTESYLRHKITDTSVVPPLFDPDMSFFQHLRLCSKWPESVPFATSLNCGSFNRCLPPSHRYHAPHHADTRGLTELTLAADPVHRQWRHEAYCADACPVDSAMTVVQRATVSVTATFKERRLFS